MVEQVAEGGDVHADVGFVVVDVAFADFAAHLPASDEDFAVVAHLDVLGAEASVDDSFRVGKGDGIAHAVEGGEDFLQVEGDKGARFFRAQIVEDLGERGAFHRLGRVEGATRVIYAQFVQRLDIGMLEATDHLRLGDELRDGGVTRGGVVANELHGDLAGDIHVLRAVEHDGLVAGDFAAEFVFVTGEELLRRREFEGFELADLGDLLLGAPQSRPQAAKELVELGRGFLVFAGVERAPRFFRDGEFLGERGVLVERLLQRFLRFAGFVELGKDLVTFLDEILPLGVEVRLARGQILARLFQADSGLVALLDDVEPLADDFVDLRLVAFLEPVEAGDEFVAFRGGLLQLRDHPGQLLLVLGVDLREAGEVAFAVVGNGFQFHERAVAFVDQRLALLGEVVEFALVIFPRAGVDGERLVALPLHGVPRGLSLGHFLGNLLPLAVEFLDRGAVSFLHLRTLRGVVFLLAEQAVALGGEKGDAHDLRLIHLLELRQRLVALFQHFEPLTVQRGDLVELRGVDGVELLERFVVPLNDPERIPLELGDLVGLRLVQAGQLGHGRLFFPHHGVALLAERFDLRLLHVGDGHEPGEGGILLHQQSLALLGQRLELFDLRLIDLGETRQCSVALGDHSRTLFIALRRLHLARRGQLGDFGAGGVALLDDLVALRGEGGDLVLLYLVGLCELRERLVPLLRQRGFGDGKHLHFLGVRLRDLGEIRGEPVALLGELRALLLEFADLLLLGVADALQFGSRLLAGLDRGETLSVGRFDMLFLPLVNLPEPGDGALAFLGESAARLLQRSDLRLLGRIDLRQPGVRLFLLFQDRRALRVERFDLLKLGGVDLVQAGQSQLPFLQDRRALAPEVFDLLFLRVVGFTEARVSGLVLPHELVALLDERGDVLLLLGIDLRELGLRGGVLFAQRLGGEAERVDLLLLRIADVREKHRRLGAFLEQLVALAAERGELRLLRDGHRPEVRGHLAALAEQVIALRGQRGDLLPVGGGGRGPFGERLLPGAHESRALGGKGGDLSAVRGHEISEAEFALVLFLRQSGELSLELGVVLLLRVELLAQGAERVLAIQEGRRRRRLDGAEMLLAILRKNLAVFLQRDDLLGSRLDRLAQRGGGFVALAQRIRVSGAGGGEFRQRGFALGGEVGQRLVALGGQRGALGRQVCEVRGVFGGELGETPGGFLTLADELGAMRGEVGGLLLPRGGQRLDAGQCAGALGGQRVPLSGQRGDVGLMTGDDLLELRGGRGLLLRVRLVGIASGNLGAQRIDLLGRASGIGGVFRDQRVALRRQRLDLLLQRGIDLTMTDEGGVALAQCDGVLLAGGDKLLLKRRTDFTDLGNGVGARGEELLFLRLRRREVLAVGLGQRGELRHGGIALDEERGALPGECLDLLLLLSGQRGELRLRLRVLVAVRGDLAVKLGADFRDLRDGVLAGGEKFFLLGLRGGGVLRMRLGERGELGLQSVALDDQRGALLGDGGELPLQFFGELRELRGGLRVLFIGGGDLLVVGRADLDDLPRSVGPGGEQLLFSRLRGGDMFRVRRAELGEFRQRRVALHEELRALLGHGAELQLQLVRQRVELRERLPVLLFGTDPEATEGGDVLLAALVVLGGERERLVALFGESRGLLLERLVLRLLAVDQGVQFRDRGGLVRDELLPVGGDRLLALVERLALSGETFGGIRLLAGQGLALIREARELSLLRLGEPGRFGEGGGLAFSFLFESGDLHLPGFIHSSELAAGFVAVAQRLVALFLQRRELTLVGGAKFIGAGRELVAGSGDFLALGEVRGGAGLVLLAELGDLGERGVTLLEQAVALHGEAVELLLLGVAELGKLRGGLVALLHQPEALGLQRGALFLKTCGQRDRVGLLLLAHRGELGALLGERGELFLLGGVHAVQFRHLRLPVGGGFLQVLLHAPQPRSQRLLRGGGLVGELRLFPRQHVALGGERGDLLALRGNDGRHFRARGLAVGDGLVALAEERFDLLLLLVSQPLRGLECLVAFAHGHGVRLVQTGEIRFVRRADFIEMGQAEIAGGDEIQALGVLRAGVLAVGIGEFRELPDPVIALGEEPVALFRERGELPLLLVAELGKVRGRAVAFLGESEAFLVLRRGQRLDAADGVGVLLRDRGALLRERGQLALLRFDQVLEFGQLGEFLGGEFFALLLQPGGALFDGFLGAGRLVDELRFLAGEDIALGGERGDLLALRGHDGCDSRKGGLPVGGRLVPLAEGGFELQLLFEVEGAQTMQRFIAFAERDGVLAVQSGEPLLVRGAQFVEMGQRLVARGEEVLPLVVLRRTVLAVRLGLLGKFRGGLVTLGDEPVALLGEGGALFLMLGEQRLHAGHGVAVLLRDHGPLLREGGELALLRFEEVLQLGEFGLLLGGKPRAVFVQPGVAGFGAFLRPGELLRELRFLAGEDIPLAGERSDLLALRGHDRRGFRARGLAIGRGLVALAEGGFELLLLLEIEGVQTVQRFVAFAERDGVLVLQAGETLLMGRAEFLEVRERLVARGRETLLHGERLRLIPHVRLLALEIAGLRLLLFGERVALLRDGGGFALLRFERLGQRIDLPRALLHGLVLLFRQSAHLRFLFLRKFLRASDRFVALLQHRLALGLGGFELLAMRLFDLRDLVRSRLLLLHFAELGQRVIPRLHRGGLLRANRFDLLLLRLPHRREFRDRLVLLAGERLLRLLDLRRPLLLLLFPLLPARLQFIALLERRRALLFEHLDALFVIRAELFELRTRVLVLPGLLRCRLLLQFRLELADLRLRLRFLLRRGAVRRFQRQQFLRPHVEILCRLHGRLGAPVQIRLQRRELLRSRHKLCRQLVMFFPRGIPLRERLFQLHCGSRMSVRVMTIPIAVPLPFRALRTLNQANDRRACRAHADRVPRADGRRALHRAFAVKSSIRASEIADREVVLGDGEFRVLARDSVAVEQDIAGQIPADDILPRIEDVSPECARAISDDDFSLCGHISLSCGAAEKLSKAVFCPKPNPPRSQADSTPVERSLRVRVPGSSSRCFRPDQTIRDFAPRHPLRGDCRPRRGCPFAPGWCGRRTTRQALCHQSESANSAKGAIRWDQCQNPKRAVRETDTPARPCRPHRRWCQTSPSAKGGQCPAVGPRRGCRRNSKPRSACRQCRRRYSRSRRSRLQSCSCPRSSA